VRIALRTLARELRFSTFVVLVLAVGIGATTTVFTVINHVLLRAMPINNPDRLVWIWSTRTDRDKAFFSIPNFLDTRGQVQTLSDLAAFANWSANLTGGSEAERLQGVRVTGNAFAMLGGKAAADG
jgi:putative ABC transport system permease protein